MFEAALFLAIIGSTFFMARRMGQADKSEP
jgi:hypothetical protein